MNSEIDYFYSVGKDSFGIEKTRKLSVVSTNELKFILKANDDSIRVFKRKNNLIVKRKGFRNLKLKPIDKTEEELNDLRDWIRTKQFIQ